MNRITLTTEQAERITDKEAVVAPEPLDRINLKGTYREGDGR